MSTLKKYDIGGVYGKEYPCGLLKNTTGVD